MINGPVFIDTDFKRSGMSVERALFPKISLRDPLSSKSHSSVAIGARAVAATDCEN